MNGSDIVVPQQHVAAAVAIVAQSIAVALTVVESAASSPAAPAEADAANAAVAAAFAAVTGAVAEWFAVENEEGTRPTGDAAETLGLLELLGALPPLPDDAGPDAAPTDVAAAAQKLVLTRFVEEAVVAARLRCGCIMHAGESAVYISATSPPFPPLLDVECNRVVAHEKEVQRKEDEERRLARRASLLEKERLMQVRHY